MPKMKTCKSAAKRFKKTAKGKVKRNQAFTSHLLSGKSQKRKRNLRKRTLVSASDMKRIATLLPY
ncbi:MAG: 50S ribosomal protein L35 [Candidatus Aureabacteria bacterium]|nr:50S ribosomal protein L35 [Candidatus Auribacterota bacterium]